MKSSSPKPSESEQKVFGESLGARKSSASTAMLTTNGGRGGGKSLKMVRKRYSDLNNLIGELPLKLSEISSDINSEFLSAYRTHMLEIQRDLQSLKQQVHEIINHDVVLTPSKQYTMCMN